MPGPRGLVTEETELGNDIQASSFDMGVRGFVFCYQGGGGCYQGRSIYSLEVINQYIPHLRVRDDGQDAV